MKSYLSLFLTFFIFVSCSSSEPIIEEVVIDYNAINETEIQDYLTQNSLSFVKSNTGLYYKITDEGIGTSPNNLSLITVYYKGYFLNNTVFQESEIDGLELNMEFLIPGFKEGMTYLKEGGEATFIIPSKLAYKEYGNGSISPGQVILYDVKLISVN